MPFDSPIIEVLMPGILKSSIGIFSRNALFSSEAGILSKFSVNLKIFDLAHIFQTIDFKFMQNILNLARNSLLLSFC